MIGRLLRGGFMTAIYAYLYIPIIILIVNSFNRSRFGINWQGFTTDWYSLLMNNDSLLQAAQHSLTMAVLSATFATLIGSLTAVALYRYRFRGKPFVSGMLFVVMMSPDIVMAISLLVLFMLIGVQLGFLVAAVFAYHLLPALRGGDRLLPAERLRCADAGGGERSGRQRDDYPAQNHPAAGSAGGGGRVAAELHPVDG